MGYDYDSQDGPTADPNTPMTEDLRAAVVAVLQAIREPSAGMKTAGASEMECKSDSGLYDGTRDALDVYHAMINAALDEGEHSLEGSAHADH